MKKKIVACLAVALLLPIVVVGCKKTQKSITTEITYDELLAQPHVTKTLELTYPDSLVVTLGSNPTTGFQWGANPAISDPAVMSQYEHNFVAATSTAIGAPGKDVWTFKPIKTGTATISFDYSRPWEGGEKGQWTVELTVVVK